ncbi:hypothetical protein AB6G46_07175 [Providencia hangzhouensis]|uniref:hypothetical protein n=1 Tax=Providencia TaxID=586 RepID=UPI001A26106E|nr:hypothetical protein [Providencia rettgeri]MCD6313796.1 hypothetical protein [Providencia rettgeri]MCS4544417.1 hypothetical protein [Providencia rettgeri]MCW4540182.1 hypothetical protein [Providencia rettgeri]MDB9557612.1 hypothetical protein [Providencia rettgeri]MDX4116363.1 hypothetical protein [Providencia rettgeri]
MDGVTDLGTITVWGSNSRPHFNDCFNNYDNAHEDIDLTGRYEKLKSILHENLYDNIKLADIHDDVNNHKIDTFQDYSTTIKNDLKSKQISIENNLITLRKDIAEIEKSPGWKFIIDPQKYPCTYKWHFQSSDSSDLKISAIFKFRTIEDRDRLLAEDFDDNIPGIPRFPFDNIDLYIDAVNKRADRDARNQLLEIKRQHKSITDKIQFNINELNKLKIAQSSMFVIPSPNVPTLPHGVGSNSQVTQTADSSIAKGIEKALGNIRDGLAETFDCSFGMSCSNDIDKAAKNPNVGKPHTGGDQIPEQGRTDTGGDQIPEHIDNTHITPLPNQITVEDIAYLSENKNNIKNKWHQGSFNSPDESLQKHYEKHGKEVGAGSVEQYRNKAEEFVKNLKGARTVKVRGATDNVTRYYKNGKYLDRTSEGKIISFGK